MRSGNQQRTSRRLAALATKRRKPSVDEEPILISGFNRKPQRTINDNVSEKFYLDISLNKEYDDTH